MSLSFIETNFNHHPLLKSQKIAPQALKIKFLSTLKQPTKKLILSHNLLVLLVLKNIKSI